MEILKNILSESKDYYLHAKEKIENRLKALPRGSVKKREIGGKFYYYLQFRLGNKIIQKYIGKDKPEEIMRKVVERGLLKKELKKVKESLKIIKRSQGKRHG
jgi:hypothetical protein